MKAWLFLCFIVPSFGFSQYAEPDWEYRDQWMPVERIIKLMNVEQGMNIADIGCHEGYFSIHLSKAVGAEGKVYAIDVRADRLDLLRLHLEDRNINNVNVILGDYDDPKLPSGELDIVVIMDTYHEMDDYLSILNHVHKSLKPHGKIMILEKLKDRVKNASRSRQVEEHTLSSKFVKRELEKSGFRIDTEVYDLGDWEEDETKPMWLVIAKKENTFKWKSRRMKK